MAAKTKETNQTKKTEFKLEQAFSLWKHTGKKGTDYFTGYELPEERKVIAFYNGKKKNPNEPDLRIYASADELGDEIAALWCNVSKKNNKKYLTGTYGKRKVVGFISESTNPNAPYLNIYYREDNPEQLKIEPEKAKPEASENPF